MNEPTDEFSFLAEQATDAGLAGALPRGERLSTELPDGRTLSAIRYTPASSVATSPEVTFLHGAGLNAHTWDSTILALGLPALLIDLPGHGDSSWRSDMAYVGRALAADIAVGMDAWTSGPQVLVGHSLGGLTAAALASARADLVRELLIVDITPGVLANEGPSELGAFFAGPTDWATRDELVDRAMDFGFGGGSRRKVERGVFFNSRVREDGRVEWKHHFAHLAPTMGTSAEKGQPQVLTSAGWEDLARITAPTTLVRGERGYVTAANATEFATRIPTASIIVIASGHNVQEEAPKELADQIRKIAQHD
ncbi:alpha/beta fold hydrolase (plasmid) [Coraliomargarita sp. W4R53]